MILAKRLCLGLLVLAAIIAFETYTNIDLVIQNYFYDAPNRQWMINPELHKRLTFFFYSGLKNLVIITAVVCILALSFSFHYTALKSNRKAFTMMLLSIIFVPLIVAGAKYITNVYCPYQLDIYNGINPFVRIMSNYPEGFIQLKSGRCFPAGHSTAGFAFMALFYCFKTRRNRILGLSLGVALGWLAGTYQMMRGQHFLSHTMFSMVACFMVIMIINYCLNIPKKENKSC